MENISLIEIPTVKDTRGNLAFIQNGTIPFEFKRVYYLFDVPSSAFRGGHSHIKQQEFLIALSGSFEVTIDSGNEKVTFFLNKPNVGLLIPSGFWRELQNFSSGAVCLVLNSDEFIEGDYIRDYQEFLQSKK
ncbi:MAG TPA: FdtA/QdtA family cupin domain-containing protein [Flavobacterium sp.]|nr:FdtA/QdtA family cupin domain-containing protein [Flavobacterium sp.]